MDNTYKYEVAFSFLASDEDLATQINNLLSERMPTFLYSERQKEIAGTDGEKTFTNVFHDESRTVVVLYRKGWGERTWTRIEETAIRNRAFEGGYDFVLFIPLDDPPTVPKWLPKTQLWICLERWGIVGAASVIEDRVQQSGGSTHPESLSEKAARVKRELETDKERTRILDSQKGVQLATQEMARIRTAVVKAVNSINSETDLGLSLQEIGETVFVQGPSFEIAFYWQNRYINTLAETRIEVTIWQPSAPKPNMVFPFEQPRKHSSTEYEFYLDSNLAPVWRLSGSENLSYSPALAEQAMSLFLDTIRARQRDK